MTKLNQILSPSFTTILSHLRQESFFLYHPASMANRSLSVSTPFCQAVVSCGYLTFEQMLHAACRYMLGESKKGGVIFWQIDHEGMPHDGKAYRYWYQTAQEVMDSPFWEGSPPIRVSTIPLVEGDNLHGSFGLFPRVTEIISIRGKG